MLYEFNPDGIGYAISVTGASNHVKRAQMRDIWSKGVKQWAKNYHLTPLRRHIS